MLKNGLLIKFSHKSSLLVSQSLGYRDIVVWKKSFFLTFRRSEATLAPFVRVPPYENKAFLINSVIPRPNTKFFDPNVVYNVPNIYLGIYKNYQNFHTLIFYVYTRLRGVGADLPPLGGIGLSFVFDGRTEYAPFSL